MKKLLQLLVNLYLNLINLIFYNFNEAVKMHKYLLKCILYY